ncbi:hypothetical protein KCP73_08465 [Salmonella enterica subsp. enterica]|nr:hypothetical protein KCP73_08465 [Salmonella enterica subsp. enterica]
MGNSICQCPAPANRCDHQANAGEDCCSPLRPQGNKVRDAYRNGTVDSAFRKGTMLLAIAAWLSVTCWQRRSTAK